MASEVCKALFEGISKELPKAEILQIPLADGGEGSLDTLAAIEEMEKIEQFIKDPLWKTKKGFYLKKGSNAFIELAQAAGLHLLNKNQLDPELTSTYGCGQQIKHAIKNGCDTVYLFIGGSATNDAAMGIAQALGFKFYSKEKEELLPAGGSLAQIFEIEKPTELPEFTLNVVCDVNNPFYGPDGAAYIYAPQKGADFAMVERLDIGLQNFAEVIKRTFKKDIQPIPGAGAAGGVAGGLVGLLKANILSGTATILDLVNFQEKLENTDLLITGEGKMDAQTLSGKLISGVAQAALAKKVIVRVICGINALTPEKFKKMGLDRVVSLVDEDITQDSAIKNTYALLVKKAPELL